MNGLPSGSIEATGTPQRIIITEEEKLRRYQHALTQLPAISQIQKMASVRSPENLKRFLSSSAPDALVHRYMYRENELAPNSLTDEEKNRINRLQKEMHCLIEGYISAIVNDGDQELLENGIEQNILEGKVGLYPLLAEIQEAKNDTTTAIEYHRRSIDSGNKESYIDLVRFYLRNQELVKAYNCLMEAKAARSPNKRAIACEVAHALYINGNSKFASEALEEVFPRETRIFPLLMEVALKQGDSPKIDDLLEARGHTLTDSNLLYAVSTLIQKKRFSIVLNEFKKGLKQCGDGVALEEIEKLESKNHTYELKCYIATYLSNVLKFYELNDIAEKLINETKN